MPERRRTTTPPTEDVETVIEAPDSDQSGESEDVDMAIAPDEPSDSAECVYPPRENQCPLCGEKLRTDLYGEVMCAIAADECPRLEG